MAFRIFPTALYHSSGTEQSFSNSSILRKFAVDNDGNLTFNGRVIDQKSLEVSYSVSLSKENISQACIALPYDCDALRAITLNLQGISFIRGSDWDVRENSYPEHDLIVWDNLGLQNIVRPGDNIFITYYRRFSS